MSWWTSRHRFPVEGHAVVVRLAAGRKALEATLEVDGIAVARAAATYDPWSNAHLEAVLPSGRRLAVEAGYNSWWTTGAVARLDGKVVHETHPGRPVAPPASLARMLDFAKAAQAPEEVARRRANWPALATDVALGLLFYAVATLADLRVAALAVAGAGLAVAVVQRFVRLDLTGGLAPLGIVMSLAGAGLATAFDDDRMIQLRATVLGLFGAALFLGDWLAGGRHLGARFARYLPFARLPEARLSLALGLAAAFMALLNLAVMVLASADQWLFYTSVLDLPVGIVAVFVALALVRRLPRANPTERARERNGG